MKTYKSVAEQGSLDLATATVEELTKLGYKVTSLPRQKQDYTNADGTTYISSRNNKAYNRQLAKELTRKWKVTT